MRLTEQLLRYLYIEYLSSTDFIANVLQQVQTYHDLRSAFSYSMVDMIRSHGYEPEVWYPNHTQSIRELLDSEIFTIKQDDLFGELLHFDLNKYLNFVGILKSNDRNYLSIAEKFKVFGEDGLRRAIGSVAFEHKWKTPTSADDVNGRANETDEPPPAVRDRSVAGRKYLVTEPERQALIVGLRELSKIADGSDLSQQDKSQARMLTQAAILIAESPTPNWRMVREILYSVAAISTVLALAVQLAELIR